MRFGKSRGREVGRKNGDVILSWRPNQRSVTCKGDGAVWDRYHRRGRMSSLTYLLLGMRRMPVAKVFFQVR